MNELDRQEDEVLEPELDDYTDPLDEVDEPLRGVLKGYRAVAVLYLVLRNADRFSAIVRGLATNLEQLLAEAEATERRDAAAPD